MTIRINSSFIVAAIIAIPLLASSISSALADASHLRCGNGFHKYKTVGNSISCITTRGGYDSRLTAGRALKLISFQHSNGGCNAHTGGLKKRYFRKKRQMDSAGLVYLRDYLLVKFSVLDLQLGAPIQMNCSDFHIPRKEPLMIETMRAPLLHLKSKRIVLSWLTAAILAFAIASPAAARQGDQAQRCFHRNRFTRHQCWR